MHAPNINLCSCPPIEVVTTQNYLGLTIDSKFNWSNHIEYVCRKLRQFLANLVILKNRIPYKVKLMLYNSLAESYVRYGLSSYGRSYNSYLKQIYRLQLKILKNIVSPKINLQCKNNDLALFRHCKILPVQSQFMYSLLKENFFNEGLKTLVKHPVHTRAVSMNRFCLQRANNVYGERTTKWCIPHLLNKLPNEFINCITRNNIKNKLKSYFLNNLEGFQEV